MANENTTKAAITRVIYDICAYCMELSPAKPTHHAYLLMGGNLGDRTAQLAEAKAWVGQLCGRVLRSSSLYETAAWGIEDQPDFLNQVLELETALPPRQLLASILEVEAKMGRTRGARYGPRTIDIDILLYGDEVLEEEDLRIPHPRLADRRFALAPLHELVPELMHPCTGQRVRSMLASCADPLAVVQYTPAVDNNG